MEDDFIGKEFNDGKLTVIGISERKHHRNKLYLVKCSECAKDSELYGDAIYEQLKSDIKRGKLPCGCSKMHRYDNRQYRLLINRVSNGKYEIISNDDISSYEHKIRLRCNVDGYEWDATVHSLIGKMKSGCKQCGIKSNADRDRNKDTDDIINRRCVDIHCKFMGYVSSYLNKRSRIKIRCDCGHDWTPEYNNFVNAKQGCPACASSGYNTSKSGVIYVTIWETQSNERFIKYGIAHNYQQRIAQHIRTTKCKLIDSCVISFDRGQIPLDIETELNRIRDSSVGRKGFIDKDIFVAFTETLPLCSLSEVRRVILEHTMCDVKFSKICLQQPHTDVL